MSWRDVMISKAKTELQPLRALAHELDSLEKQIDKYNADICALQATDYSKDIVSGGQPCEFSEKVAKLVDMKKHANALWDKLIDGREHSQKVIDRIDNGIFRALLTQRYILAETWENTALAMHFCERHVRRLEEKALFAYGKKMSGYVRPNL